METVTIAAITYIIFAGGWLLYLVVSLIIEIWKIGNNEYEQCKDRLKLKR